MGPESQTRFNQAYIVYTPKEQGAYLIPETEWARVKRQVLALPTKSPTLERWSIWLAGIAVTTLLQLVTGAPDKSWLLIAVISICITSTVLAFILFLLSNDERDEREIRAKEIVSEMDEIEGRYEKSSTSDPTEPDSGNDESVYFSDVNITDDYDLKAGELIYHPNYGYGNVIELGRGTRGRTVRVDFRSGESKTVLLEFARLKNVNKRST